jgi:hypothetical protein
MRVALVLAGLVLFPAVLVADDHIVQFDRTVDFSIIRTFTFRGTTIASDRPELNNPLVLSKVTDTIRTLLTAKGLRETPDRPDVVVEFTVTGQDYSVGPFGRASRIEGGRGGRGGSRRGGDPQSAQPVAFIEGVLVLDVIDRESGLLVWRGVYRDSERDNARFARKLPDDARKLLSEYPPKKK